jgi:all-trans-8'-apo-beta-carotenal 15,15'-oxygenase
MLSAERILAASAPAKPGVADHEFDFSPGIEKMFSLRPSESSYLIHDIEGQVPSFIAGRYYLNGPALFSQSGLEYRHWLDGDGMVYSLRFEEQGVRFTNRFVRTTKFKAEREMGRPLFRTFGTAFPGDMLRRGIALESPGNISVYPFRERLLALGEQALPWELKSETLETVGECSFGGALSEISPFSAHPKFDPSSGEMFNFGIFFSGKAASLTVYCFDGGGNLRLRRRQQLLYPGSIHDFGLTANYAVFYLSPYILDVDALVRGGNSVMESLHWEPWRGSQLLIVSRRSGNQVASVPIGERYSLHTINCFEQEDHLVADVIEFDRPVYDQYCPLPQLFTNVPLGRPARLVVDLKTSQLISRHELDYHMSPDFPAIDPRCSACPYSDCWMLGLSAVGHRGRKFFDQLVHARWNEAKLIDVYQAAHGHYLGGEPVFIPEGSGSQHGAIMCQEFDAEHVRSSFLIFNASDIANGPIARLRLKEPIHLAFHACFQTDDLRMNSSTVL